ncbi:hypothetical protein HDV06_006896 [Boothiomyces sp. JEL0866]|nr:hypothetical protein HDV06_006896 [Boothiomyces sp. JEL0866]
MGELLGLKNQFYVGQYQTVINEATNPQFLAKLNPQQQLEQRVLLHRAYLVHGRYNLVIQDIKSSDPDVLIAIQLLATVLAQPSKAPEITHHVQQMINHIEPEAQTYIVLSTILTIIGLYDEALKLVSKFPRDLECVSIFIQLLCLIDRVDIAYQEIEKIKTWADDAVLAQLAESWAGIYSGSPQKFQEAFYLYEELAATYQPSAKILTAKAVCLMQIKSYDQAETFLLEALNKNPNDADTLANLIVNSTFLHKPQNVIDQYFSQLKDLAPNHKLVFESEKNETLFDNLASAFH